MRPLFRCGELRRARIRAAGYGCASGVKSPEPLRRCCGFDAGAGKDDAALEEPFVQSDVTLTAVPAVDGFGDAQVSWVIQGGGKRIIHCGDSLWHGHWWRIRRKHGPFDAAFLCINGVVMTYPGLEPSGIPADMTAGQAVAAGKLLDAGFVCPIHYGTFNASQYSEPPDVEGTFLAAARARGVAVQIIPPGNLVTWNVSKAERA